MNNDVERIKQTLQGYTLLEGFSVYNENLPTGSSLEQKISVYQKQDSYYVKNELFDGDSYGLVAETNITEEMKKDEFLYYMKNVMTNIIYDNEKNIVPNEKASNYSTGINLREVERKVVPLFKEVKANSNFELNTMKHIIAKTEGDNSFEFVREDLYKDLVAKKFYLENTSQGIDKKKEIVELSEGDAIYFYLSAAQTIHESIMRENFSESQVNLIISEYLPPVEQAKFKKPSSQVDAALKIDDLERGLRLEITPADDFDLMKLYIVEKANVSIEKHEAESLYQRFYKKLKNDSIKEIFQDYHNHESKTTFLSTMKSMVGVEPTRIDKLAIVLAEGYARVQMETMKAANHNMQTASDEFMERVKLAPNIKLYKLEAESLLSGQYLILDEYKQNKIDYLKNIINERNDVIVYQAKKLKDMEQSYSKLKVAYDTLVHNVKKTFGVSEEKLLELKGLNKKDLGGAKGKEKDLQSLKM